MKETRDIISAYQIAHENGIPSALATVVKVQGSSYRQPGARMLVTADGSLTGAISGGCLEGDALRKALLCINQKQNKLITYDTSNEDDAEFGVQLGCNGIVHILFEYIDESSISNPIEILKQIGKQRIHAAILTLFSTDRNKIQPGTSLFISDDDSAPIGNSIGKQFLSEVSEVLESEKSVVKNVSSNDESYEALIEFIPPSLSLIVAGAGNDVMPLVKTASILGWEITVADGRSTHTKPQRFPEAKVILAKPSELISQITVDSRTFLVLMTHNYKYDLALLKLVLDTDVAYIGILGPKTKLDRMISDLSADGIEIPGDQLKRIFGPVGLDIGAETSEEIALSVVAEIKAIETGRDGSSLKFKSEKIHAQPKTVVTL